MSDGEVTRLFKIFYGNEKPRQYLRRSPTWKTVLQQYKIYSDNTKYW
jgi:hypothetical protein